MHEAQRLAAVLPAWAQRLPPEAGADALTGLAHQAIITLHAGAARRSMPGAGAIERSEAEPLTRAAEAVVLELIAALPVVVAAEFADDLARHAPTLRAHFHDEPRQRIALTGFERVAQFVEGFPNVFAAYRPDEPRYARWLLWWWRSLAGHAGVAEPGRPEPRLATYLGRVLDATPTALSDILSLAESLGDNLAVSRILAPNETMRSLDEMFDGSRLKVLTMQATARAEVDAMRWPNLVHEMAERVFAVSPTDDDGDGRMVARGNAFEQHNGADS